MKRLYTKWKRIWPWRWKQCSNCNRFFRYEDGWYGWYEFEGDGGYRHKIKKYVCHACCRREREADDFFAQRCEWFPGITTPRMPQHIREVRHRERLGNNPFLTEEQRRQLIQGQRPPPTPPSPHQGVSRASPSPPKRRKTEERHSRYDLLKGKDGR